MKKINMIIEKYNDCPFMRAQNKKHPIVYRCYKYSSEYGRFLADYTYNINLIFKDICIPNWCPLEDM
jgi:hypothetical protein